MLSSQRIISAEQQRIIEHNFSMLVIMNAILIYFYIVFRKLLCMPRCNIYMPVY